MTDLWWIRDEKHDFGILQGVVGKNKSTSIMDKDKALELARQYKEVVAEHLPVRALYLYGSYSKGNFTEESDIDIAVIVSKRSDNFFEDTPLLWKLGRRVSYLIEPVLLTEDEGSPLYEDILRTGILV